MQPEQPRLSLPSADSHPSNLITLFWMWSGILSSTQLFPGGQVDIQMVSLLPAILLSALVGLHAN